MTPDPEPSPKVSAAERLTDALASATANASAPPPPADDAELSAVAAADETRRARFDEILATSSALWAAESDGEKVRAALVAVLDEIRGPAAKVVEIAGRAEGEVENGGIGEGEGGVEDQEDAMDESSDVGGEFRERARYIPLRLTAKERKILRLVEGALNVSNYTDVVDVVSYSRMKTKQRMYSQILDLCSVLVGLLVATDYAAGQAMIVDRGLSEQSVFYQDAFEIARRHKISNPEKMRSNYGKLVFMLQDSQGDDISKMLDFSCVRGLRTVGAFLDEVDGGKLLDDGLVATATQQIMPHGKSRSAIQRKIKEKERAVESIARRYMSSQLTSDDIRQCLYSIGDNNSYLSTARDPCEELLGYLVKNFGPSADRKVAHSKLGIRVGVGGARLTHDHARQYTYCQQSLSLWSEISLNMYQLWCKAEEDLFDANNTYSLRNTGQGLNRVQASPRVGRVMSKILHSVQKRVGGWVGSSVIHLGDSNVPNSLFFIDKYAQLPRILMPICTVLRRIPQLAEDDDEIRVYIENSFGGVESAKRMILQDFFRHAFDGSGGTNAFNSGSCVDGRLTSTFEWSQNIEKKAYFPLFLLTGFTTFNGSDFSS